MKKKIFSAIAVLALSAALPLSACANNGGGGEESSTPAPRIIGETYYVSADATSSGDGSQANPYTIEKVLNDWVGTGDSGREREDKVLHPGDTVLVQPGVYKINSRLRMTASGEHNGMITVKNASTTGEKVILDFSAMAFDGNNRGVELYSNYVHWYGIDICGAGDNGLYVGGSYNVIEYSEFYNNRDTGLQLGRKFNVDNTVDTWPSYNLIKNCTSHNNYDNETYGENADGFAAKLTVGAGNVFDGCIAYRNSDDGWDLYAKTDSGNIGQVIIYNCVAYENGYLEYTQRDNNKLYPTWTGMKTESIDENKQPVMTGEEKYGKLSFKTRDGDGNGFKLGGSVMEGDVLVYNCLAFNNRMHGVTDNSNPGYLKLDGITSYNNSANVDDNPYLINPDTNKVDPDMPNPNFGLIINKAYDCEETIKQNNEEIPNPTYGQIVSNPNHDTHGNINVSRQTYSYNTVRRTVSVRDEYGISVEPDEYRGSVTDSLLLGSGKANKVVGSIDADSKAGKKYTSVVDSLVATEIFEKLPFVETSEYQYTINITGLHDLGGISEGTINFTSLNADRAHHKYRNADGSINMHDILKIKDYSKLLGDNNKIGADLSQSTWGGYTHFSEADWNSETSSAVDAVLIKAKEVLTVNADEHAVYQDFDVSSKLGNCTVDWTSDNDSILHVNGLKSEDVMTSKAEYVTISVTRPTDGDKVVKLTAKISYLNRSITKEFELTVKQDTPSIGGLSVHVNSDGSDILDGGRLILDMYRQYEEPVLNVENGAYYNGTLLKPDQYTVTTKYEYAKTDSSNDGDYSPVNSFTPNKAGVFRITHTVKLNGSEETKKMTYKIFVASTTAELDFVGKATIVVNRDGYTIGGALNSPTGKLYAASSATDLGEINATQLKEMANVQSYSFRDTAINKQFASATNNSAKYYIYYALENLNEEVTSPVYKTEIKVVNISTQQQFMTVAGGGTIGSSDDEVPEETIYLLTTDLNFSGVSWSRGTKAFTGFFNGAGHKIYNLSISLDTNTNDLGVFYSLKGGTIENIKFEDVTISGGKQQTGIIGTMYGGYVHNISLTNVTISGTTRVGFIGHAFESPVPTYISNISIVNDESHSITGSSHRVAGIIGLIQTTSAPEDGVEVYVSDCYINTYLKGEQQVGGIVGSYDNAKAGTPYYLEIEHCVFVGTAETTYSTPRVGGIIGYQSGAIGCFYIHHCVSVGTLINKSEITVSQKTASPIVGGFATTAENYVEYCAALMQEYNDADYDVRAVIVDTLADKDYFFSTSYPFYLAFNSEYWEPVLKKPDADDRDSDYNVLIYPYVTLKFIENA